MPRIAFVLGTVSAALLLDVGPGNAQVYPWCAHLKLPGGATNCGFVTEAQCRVTVSGVGGYCYRNPWYQPAAGKPRPVRASGRRRG